MTGKIALLLSFPLDINPRKYYNVYILSDAIHNTVHEMARDEVRHGKAFEGLLKRYFS